MGARGSRMKTRPVENVNEPFEGSGEEEGPAVDKEHVVEEELDVGEEPIVDEKHVEDKQPVEEKEHVSDEEPAANHQPVVQTTPDKFSNWTKGTWERLSDDPTLRVVVAGASWATEPGHLMNQFKGIGYLPEPRCGYEGGFKRKCTISHVEIDGETLVLQIWDGTLGERDQFMRILKEDHVGLMLLYDVRENCTFERVKKYATIDIRKKVLSLHPSPSPHFPSLLLLLSDIPPFCSPLPFPSCTFIVFHPPLSLSFSPSSL